MLIDPTHDTRISDEHLKRLLDTKNPMHWDDRISAPAEIYRLRVLVKRLRKAIHEVDDIVESGDIMRLKRKALRRLIREAFAPVAWPVEMHDWGRRLLNNEYGDIDEEIRRGK